MSNIRMDLIKKELGCFEAFQPFTPSNRMIDWLFRRYQLDEITEHWYDDEEGIEFNNWIEVVGDGIWGYTQKTATRFAKQILKYVRSCGIPRANRFYIRFDRDHAYLYWYGRDMLMVDYWWVFDKRGDCRG